MTSIPDPIHDIALACDLLQKQLAVQRQEIERLRQERDDYWKLAQFLVGEDINANPAGWEALIQTGMKHGVDFTEEVNEILAELEPMAVQI